MYKLFESMTLYNIKHEIEKKVENRQAGFQPRKSCTGQVLNLVHYIEGGYETKSITSVAHIDLTAAYDIVNHRLLLKNSFKSQWTLN